jgi:hypothetical protein
MGEAFEIVNICSHSRLYGEIVSAVCIATLHRISPSYRRSGPEQYLQPIAGGTFLGPKRDSRFWAGAAQSQSS